MVSSLLDSLADAVIGPRKITGGPHIFTLMLMHLFYPNRCISSLRVSQLLSSRLCTCRSHSRTTRRQQPHLRRLRNNRQRYLALRDQRTAAILAGTRQPPPPINYQRTLIQVGGVRCDVTSNDPAALTAKDSICNVHGIGLSPGTVLLSHHNLSRPVVRMGNTYTLCRSRYL